MCSFLVTSLTILNLVYANYYQTFRGPDKTNQVDVHGIQFVHNLLHLTGVATVQPFILKSATEDIAALFNGEIYNYDDIGKELQTTFKTDGETLIPMYLKYGTKFTQHLDGEFATVLWDFKKKLIVISTDTFGVKPLWLAIENKQIGIASYESALLRLGFKVPTEMDPNTVLVLNSETYETISTFSVHTFDLKQHKTDLTDWTTAFENSIRKRTYKMQYPVFIGLSSGYDSGAISCALNKLKVAHKSFTIVGKEDVETLNRRIAVTKETNDPTLIDLTLDDFQAERKTLQETCEPYTYLKEDGSRDRSDRQMLGYDKAATGLGYICKIAKSRGMRIYLSGSGADEIMSDYGFQGTKFYSHSSFGGLFPERLEDIFPWPSFFMSTQRNYLRKEEYIAGAHSMEGRYPFLDVQLVQEYLWLTAEMKNRVYKHPVTNYLKINNYPISPDMKVGFSTLTVTQVILLFFQKNLMFWVISLAAAVGAFGYRKQLRRKFFPIGK